MIHELVITSARRGLRGGEGFQPVLCTAGIPAELVERLRMRSGYSHPYPHGDARNPVVVFHRIERLAGRTWHVLAQVADAGADHTGRSNLLADLVAVEGIETIRCPAGPAEAANRLGLRRRWNEEPHESRFDPGRLVAADRKPGRCDAWMRAGLDPRLAGDLVEAAMAGREVVLVSRSGHDMLALFGDAIALLPPAKRWQVTFTTCALERFAASWQAVREDLPQAVAARRSRGVIDLTRSPSPAGNGPYHRFAATGEGMLPWQQADVPERRGLPGSVGTGAARAVRRIPAVVSAAAQSPPAGRQSARESAGDAFHSASSTSTRGRRGRSNRGLLARVMAVVTLLMIVLIAALGVARSPGEAAAMLAGWRRWASPPLRNSSDQAAEEGVTRKRSSRAPRDTDSPKLRQRADDNQGENRAKADHVAEPTAHQPVEPPQPASPAMAQPAPKEETAEKAKALAARRREAFQSLGALTETVVRDLPDEFDAHNNKNTAPPDPIDLGPFDVDHLVTPSFTVAVPVDKSGLGRFEVRVVPREEAEGPRRWVIAETGPEFDDNRLIPLAELEATGGTLRLRAVDSSVYGRPGFLLLRRSVLLVRAADPDQPGAAAEIRREIRLVRPQEGPPPKGIRLVDNRVTIAIRCPPVALKSPETRDAPRLPRGWHARCRVEYGFDRSGTRRPEGRPVVETFTLTGEGGEGAAMSHEYPLLDVQPTPGRSFHTNRQSSFSLAFKISPAEGVIEVEPAVTGPARDAWSIGDLRELVETSDKKHAGKKEQIVMKDREKIRIEEENRYRPLLSSPATITVEKVWTTAVDEAGTTYEVPLVTLAARRPDSASPQKNTPSLD